MPKAKKYNNNKKPREVRSENTIRLSCRWKMHLSAWRDPKRRPHMKWMLISSFPLAFGWVYRTNCINGLYLNNCTVIILLMACLRSKWKTTTTKRENEMNYWMTLKGKKKKSVRCLFRSFKPLGLSQSEEEQLASRTLSSQKTIHVPSTDWARFILLLKLAWEHFLYKSQQRIPQHGWLALTQAGSVW